jgi:muramidase (phage lysozyme)
VDADRLADKYAQLTAFDKTVNTCEGSPGYDDLFGYRKFTDFSQHPNVRIQFTNSKGVVQYTTAAGYFQINFPTWVDFITACGPHDFSPSSQHECGHWLMSARAHAMDDILAGRLQSALDKCAGIWASLPASNYPQPKRDYAYAQTAFTGAGGVLA